MLIIKDASDRVINMQRHFKNSPRGKSIVFKKNGKVRFVSANCSLKHLTAGGFFAPKGSHPPNAGAFNPRKTASPAAIKEKTSNQNDVIPRLSQTL